MLRVIAGRAYGEQSPVRVFTDTFNVAIDLDADADAEIAIDDAPVERALYVLEGEARLDGADIPDKHLVVLDRGTRPVLRAMSPVTAMLFGGEPLDAPRHMWWNFVSSSMERIEQAKQDWLDGHSARYRAKPNPSPCPGAEANSTIRPGWSMRPRPHSHLRTI